MQHEGADAGQMELRQRAAALVFQQQNLGNRAALQVPDLDPVPAVEADIEVDSLMRRVAQEKEILPVLDPVQHEHLVAVDTDAAVCHGAEDALKFPKPLFRAEALAQCQHYAAPAGPGFDRFDGRPAV